MNVLDRFVAATLLIGLAATVSFSQPSLPSAASTTATTGTTAPPLDERLEADYVYLLERVNELEAEAADLRRDLAETTAEAEAENARVVELQAVYDELAREHERYKEYFRALHHRPPSKP